MSWLNYYLTEQSLDDEQFPVLYCHLKVLLCHDASTLGVAEIRHSLANMAAICNKE